MHNLLTYAVPLIGPAYIFHTDGVFKVIGLSYTYTLPHTHCIKHTQLYLSI